MAERHYLSWVTKIWCALKGRKPNGDVDACERKRLYTCGSGRSSKQEFLSHVDVVSSSRLSSIMILFIFGENRSNDNSIVAQSKCCPAKLCPAYILLLKGSISHCLPFLKHPDFALIPRIPVALLICVSFPLTPTESRQR